MRPCWQTVILRHQPREQSWELERNAARGGGVHERISIFAVVFGFFDLDQSRSPIQLQDMSSNIGMKVSPDAN